VELSYEEEEYTIILTNRRIIGHKRGGSMWKKGSYFSVALEEVTNLRYSKMGLISKKGILVIETWKELISLEGKVGEVKDVWHELSEYLRLKEEKRTPTASKQSYSATDLSDSSVTDKTRSDKVTIKIVKINPAAGEISEEEFH
jgi:hypothetical protein